MLRIRSLLWLLALASACSDADGALLGGSDTTSSTSDAESTEGDPPLACTPGARACEGDNVNVCTAAGDGWMIEACASDETCRDGACVSVPEVHVVTEVLVPAQVGTPYMAQLQADGGTPAYSWTLDDPPPGLELDGQGMLEGTPEEAGDYVLDVVVQDTLGQSAARKLSLAVHSEPLTILTPPDLGAVLEGLPFEKPLIAQGGIPPYGWFLVGGDVPAGVILDGAGKLTGTPTTAGPFDFTVRVVDLANPPGWDELDFTMQVDLRPLSIIGEQEIDLLAFKIITLPLIAIIPGIPVPYDTQLQATGGLVPYTWSEQPVPDALQFLVTEAGVPDGLTLDADGTLSGAVTTTDQVITLDIPLSAISLTGFFFYAEVADSQDPAETAQALFLIPTVPVGG